MRASIVFSDSTRAVKPALLIAFSTCLATASTFCAVLVKDDHGRCVIAAGGIPALDLDQRFLRVFAHHLGVRVHIRVRVGEDLRENAAHLLPPFFPVGFQEAGRLVPIQEEVPACPAVFERELGEHGQNAGRRLVRKPVNRDDLAQTCVQLGE